MLFKKIVLFKKKKKVVSLFSFGRGVQARKRKKSPIFSTSHPHLSFVILVVIKCLRGAMVARLPPKQKVEGSNPFVGFFFFFFFFFFFPENWEKRGKKREGVEKRKKIKKRKTHREKKKRKIKGKVTNQKILERNAESRSPKKAGSGPKWLLVSLFFVNKHSLHKECATAVCLFLIGVYDVGAVFGEERLENKKWKSDLDYGKTIRKM